MNVVTESVAAYSDHIKEYAEANANKMSKEFATFVDLVKGPVVLDAGCGPGRDLARFKAYGLRAAGVDLSPEMITEASHHGDAMVADLRDLPFVASAFDGIWACASLVHLDEADAGEALLELARVSKANAPLYVSVKADGETGWRDTAHGRRWFKSWTLGEFATVVEDAGFTVTSAQVSGPFVDVWADA